MKEKILQILEEHKDVCVEFMGSNTAIDESNFEDIVNKIADVMSRLFAITNMKKELQELGESLARKYSEGQLKTMPKAHTYIAFLQGFNACLELFEGKLISTSQEQFNISDVSKNMNEFEKKMAIEEEKIKEEYRLYQLGTQGIDIYEEGAYRAGWSASKDFFKPDVVKQSEQSYKIVENGKCMLCGDVSDTKDGWICEYCRKF